MLWHRQGVAAGPVMRFIMCSVVRAHVKCAVQFVIAAIAAQIVSACKPVERVIAAEAGYFICPIAASKEIVARRLNVGREEAGDVFARQIEIDEVE